MAGGSAYREEQGLIQRMIPSLFVVLMGAIIIWSIATIQQSQLEVSEIKAALRYLERKPNPPPWVAQRLDSHQTEMYRLQRQIDRLENALNAKGKPLPPYTDRNGLQDQGYSQTLFEQIQMTPMGIRQN